MKKVLFLALLLVWSVVSALGQEVTADSLVLDYYRKVPQEKIYLHTDKSTYIAGDTIWFRAHTVDAATNKPVCRSRYLYVELLSANNDRLVERAMLKADSDSVFANMLALSDDLPAGQYTLAAYTQWMRNFGQDSFFRKQLTVADSTHRNADTRVIRRLKAIALDVMPEGGHLIAGRQQRLAFKAIGNDGNGVDVSVRLLNDHGDCLQEARSVHLGMGYLSVNVQAGEHLVMEATTTDGLTCRTEVPAALKTGVSLMVVRRKDYVLVQPVSTDDVSLERFTLVIHGAGNLMTIPLQDANATSAIRIQTKAFREGVVSFAIVDDAMTIWAERLAFISRQGADNPSPSL